MPSRQARSDSAVDLESPKRGAIPTPRSVLAAANPHFPIAAAPPQFLVKPTQLDMWGNGQYGDCTTAEEAFAKACYSPEIFIPAATVIAWAQAHGFLNGAGLVDVMQHMQRDGFHAAAAVYDDGAYSSVDWTSDAVLQSAIALGPVKIGIAANQLQTAWRSTNGRSGWFGLGWVPDAAEDHCVSLCGYGTLSWLAAQFGVSVPSGVDGTRLGYALYTWATIGIVDRASMVAVTHEAWLRQPTTVIIGPTPPPPPPPPANPPVIAKFAPPHAHVGDFVILQGTNFDPWTLAMFSPGVEATEYGNRDVIGLQARIPAGATSGPLYVVRGSDGARSAPVAFVVDGAPDPNPNPNPNPPPPPPPPPPTGFAVAVTVEPTGRTLHLWVARINITGGQAPFRVSGNIAGRNLPNLSRGRVSSRDLTGAHGETVTITAVDATGKLAIGSAVVP